MSESFQNFKPKTLEDTSNKNEVKAFEYRDLKPNKLTSFKTPTLKGSVSDYVRDSRFQFDPLVKDLMVHEDVEDEQAKQVQMEVERRIEVVQAEVTALALKSGHAEGFAKGEQEAKLKFEAEFKGQIDGLAQMIAGFDQIKSQIVVAQEKYLIEVVYRIVTQLVRRELQTDREYLSRTIHDILEKVESRELLRIHVAESELQQIYALVPELEKQHSSLKNISIEPSSHLGPHDVVLETDWNRIDATLDSQLESFKELLMPSTTETKNA